MIQLNDKLVEVLQELYNCVYSEECGNNVRISDSFSSKELKKLYKEAKIPPVSNLTENEMEGAIREFLFDNPNIKAFDIKIVNTWLRETDLNGTAKRIFRNKLKTKLKNHDRTE